MMTELLLLMMMMTLMGLMMRQPSRQAGRQQLGNQATRQLNNQKATAGKAAFYMSRIRNEAQIARISRKSRDAVKSSYKLVYNLPDTNTK